MSTRLRQRVIRRARDRCEYCHLPARYHATPMQLDHILAEQHRGGTSFLNLAYICAHCNRHKGPNLTGIDPRTRRITRLFNPRTDEWHEHFRWRDATLVGQLGIGRTRVEVLAMNAEPLASARAELLAEGLAQEFA